MEYTDILVSVRKVARAINLDSKRIQKESDLSIPQLLTLYYLCNSENYESSQLNLRKYLQLNSSTVTGIVSRLIKKGYVAKIPSKQDKRSTWLCLTANGLKRIENIPQLFQERLTHKLAQLPERDVQTIENGLNKLIEILGDEELTARLEEE